MSPGIKFKELQSVLNYMYKGETFIEREDLPALLQLAETLQIRGLADTPTPKAPTPNHGCAGSAGARLTTTTVAMANQNPATTVTAQAQPAQGFTSLATAIATLAPRLQQEQRVNVNVPISDPLGGKLSTKSHPVLCDLKTGWRTPCPTHGEGRSISGRD